MTGQVYGRGTGSRPRADPRTGSRQTFKYVATPTPLDRDWASSHVVEGGLVDFVRQLKMRTGGDIGVHASISVTQALLAAELVGELRVVIAPTVAGSGRSLFEGLPPTGLETIRGTASPSGYLLADYRVLRQDAGPARP